MICDVDKATEWLENELWRRWSYGIVGEWAELIVTVIAELILQPLSLHLRHSSFSYPSFASCTSQALHLMNRDHSTIFPSLHLRHSSLSNPSVSLPTSQLILQPFCSFTYVTAHSPTLLSLLLCHRLFTYVTWRAAHGRNLLWFWENGSYATLLFFLYYNRDFVIAETVEALGFGIKSIFVMCNRTGIALPPWHSARRWIWGSIKTGKKEFIVEIKLFYSRKEPLLVVEVLVQNPVTIIWRRAGVRVCFQ